MSIARNLADFARSLLPGGIFPIPNATTSTDGLQSAGDKTKLDGIPADIGTYRLRAAVNFNGVPLSGTYSRTGTLVTVTMTAHGMTTGQVANLDFTTGTATDGTYTVTVTGVNEFTVTDTVSGATSGNVTRQIFMRSSLNVSSITDNGVGDYTINFTSALPDANYLAIGTCTNNDGSGWGEVTVATGGVYSTTQCRIRTIGYTAFFDSSTINLVFFR